MRDRRRDQQPRDGCREDLRVFGPEGELESGQVGYLRGRGQQALANCGEQDQDADGWCGHSWTRKEEVTAGYEECGDLALDEEALGHVPGVGREDRVDPRTRQVGGGERQEGDLLSG